MKTSWQNRGEVLLFVSGKFLLTLPDTMHDGNWGCLQPLPCLILPPTSPPFLMETKSRVQGQTRLRI